MSHTLRMAGHLILVITLSATARTTGCTVTSTALPGFQTTATRRMIYEEEVPLGIMMPVAMSPI